MGLGLLAEEAVRAAQPGRPASSEEPLLPFQLVLSSCVHSREMGHASPAQVAGGAAWVLSPHPSSQLGSGAQRWEGVASETLWNKLGASGCVTGPPLTQAGRVLAEDPGQG